MEKNLVPSIVKDQHLVKRRREQMVNAAVVLLKKKGFDRITTREIAREAGFSIGTLYEYIGRKEDILYLVCDSIFEEVRDRLEASLTKGGNGIDSLEEVISSLFKVMDEMQDEVLVMYQETKSLPKNALPYVLKKDEELTKIIEETILNVREAGGISLSDKECWLLAHNIIVSGQMWTFRRWALRKTCTLEEYTKMQVNLLLHKLV
ncbi:TetR/AcrR family transcriptional regulator [Thalassorhabdus alkalitolerans]|uniref:TetR/AcrR family transcriptional regulator n=1 Tax=Thalassorhabdus alkalitolerans TaxID=2282697 RepID=A0ABW0YKK1_9BACI